MRGALGPGAFFGDLMTSGGAAVIGPHHGTVAFWLGAIIALAGIWPLGVLIRNQARRGVDAWVDRLFSNVPVIKAIYRPISQVVRLLNRQQDGDFQGMSVVMCRFGGAGGADVLALLTTRETYSVNGEPRKLIYLLTSPVPMSGGLGFVPASSVTPMPEMDIDDLMKIYFSRGALAPGAMAGSLRAEPTPAEAPG